MTMLKSQIGRSGKIMTLGHLLNTKNFIILLGKKLRDLQYFVAMNGIN